MKALVPCIKLVNVIKYCSYYLVLIIQSYLMFEIVFLVAGNKEMEANLCCIMN